MRTPVREDQFETKVSNTLRGEPLSRRQEATAPAEGS
jgi:hypothetical protein